MQNTVTGVVGPLAYDAGAFLDAPFGRQGAGGPACGVRQRMRDDRRMLLWNRRLGWQGRTPRHVRGYIRSAPGTYIWLAVLFFTTVALHHMSPDFEEDFLRQRSTNIHELSNNPVRVLITSAMWIDGGFWFPYAALFTVFHAQTERWLGTARWLVVCVAAHVLATLASEGALLEAIRRGVAPESSVNTLDIGVSYALAGVMAVLTYRIAAPWRYPYAAAVLAVYGLPMFTSPTFIDFGHFISVVIGLGCYPLVRGRGKAWNPKETLAALRG